MNLLSLATLLFVVFASTATSNTPASDNVDKIAAITNPYYSGCLRRELPGWKKQRVCSSVDEDFLPTIANSDDEGSLLCAEPAFDYMEIRVGVGNWDSATILGWLTQIILSEILGVPTSIESGAFGSSRDFYDPKGAIDYNKSMSDAPLITATDLPDGDCRSLPRPNSSDDYEPCAHFMPEFWAINMDNIKSRKVEPPQGTGFLGHEAWFVTKFTADEYPEVVSYHGLAKNREKWAQVFKRPTTWIDYCSEVSANNCTTPDEVAQRAPRNKEEAARMFAPDLYTGHFRATPKNNCTRFPSNCTGHIANYPCDWSSNMEANLYHLNIPLDSKNGPNGGPKGYTDSQLKEMWHAANATKSHLMMMWWTPEPLYQKYLGEDAEFQRVVLKPYTFECDKAREEWKDECSPDLETRVSVPEAACDNPAEPMRKLINAGLVDVLNSPDIPEAAKSPAYDVLRLFQITEVQLGQLFDLWQSEPTPRDAVCRWAADNFKVLNSTVPSSYPRVTRQEPHSELGFFALALAGLATVLILLTSWLVHRNRSRPSIQFAQLDFLFILLTGSFLVSVGAILASLPASDVTCVSSIWFVYLGYTVELVPLIIKVAAINKMMDAARSMRRITLRRGTLHKVVGVISCCFIVYLAVWTSLDPPEAEKEYSLTKATTDLGERIVQKTYFCSVDSDAWPLAAETWNAVLLLCASVLAFQTRNVVRQFNESRTLAFMIYSHFVFVVLRMSTFFLSDSLDGSKLDQLRSLFFAIDQILACGIYFLPKLTNTRIEERSTGSSAFHNGFSGPIDTPRPPFPDRRGSTLSQSSGRNHNANQDSKGDESSGSPKEQPPAQVGNGSQNSKPDRVSYQELVKEEPRVAEVEPNHDSDQAIPKKEQRAAEAEPNHGSDQEVIKEEWRAGEVEPIHGSAQTIIKKEFRAAEAGPDQSIKEKPTAAKAELSHGRFPELIKEESRAEAPAGGEP